MLYFESPLLRRSAVTHGFSVRTGGVSPAPYDSLNLGGAVGDDPEAVEQNHRLLFDAAGVPSVRIATVRQVHGDRVVFARIHEGAVVLADARGGDALPSPVEADAIIAEPGAGAAVRTADCVPILVHDPNSGASAAVHAGWRGTMSRIVVRTIQKLTTAFEADPAQLVVAIGPAIAECCFEVGADLATKFEADPAFGPGVVTPARDARGPTVDLFAANVRLLHAAGVAPTNIHVMKRCTSCEPQVFFSHRRDQGITGRHLSFIVSAT